MNKSMTRGKLIFICTWLGIFALAFLIWAFYLGRLSRDLAEYEIIQQKYTAESVFNEYFLNADAEKIAEYCGDITSPYDKESADVAAVLELMEGKSLTCDREDENAVYAVYADGVKFASFTLKEIEDSYSVLGSKPCELDSIEIFFEPSVEVVVFAPKSAVVKVNGKPVGDDCREGDYVTLDFDSASISDPNALLMAYYRITGLFADPDVTVESQDGSVKFGLEYDKESSTYSAEYTYRSYLTVSE